MLATRVRERPHMARERWLSLRGVSVTPSSPLAISISSTTVQLSSPLGPLTLTFCPSSVRVTPAGIGIAFLPIRDMILSSPALVDAAEDFAADVGVARGCVGHDALGGRQDRDPEAVLHRFQVADGRIDPAARL